MSWIVVDWDNFKQCKAKGICKSRSSSYRIQDPVATAATNKCDRGLRPINCKHKGPVVRSHDSVKNRFRVHK